MTIIDIIRLVGPEFSDVSDENLAMWIEVVEPMVSKKQFGKLYQQAVAYLVCHKMKLIGLGESPMTDASIAAIGFGVSSVSEGGSSLSLGASQSSNLATDAELTLTAYGLQYLSLRRMVIIPIRISGEDNL